MGNNRYYEQQARSETKRLQEVEAQAVETKRMALADKIVMAVVDRIAADIIRPGPKAEERECYVMAQELRDHSEHIKVLVAEILEIEANEG